MGKVHRNFSVCQTIVYSASKVACVLHYVAKFTLKAQINNNVCLREHFLDDKPEDQERCDAVQRVEHGVAERPRAYAHGACIKDVVSVKPKDCAEISAADTSVDGVANERRRNRARNEKNEDPQSPVFDCRDFVVYFWHGRGARAKVCAIDEPAQHIA